MTLGTLLGDNEGTYEGEALGSAEGWNEGTTLGDIEGVADGLTLGNLVGDTEGQIEGLYVGRRVGAHDGPSYDKSNKLMTINKIFYLLLPIVDVSFRMNPVDPVLSVT